MKLKEKETLQRLEGTYLFPFVKECFRLWADTPTEQKQQLCEEYSRTGDEVARDQVFRIMVPLAVSIALYNEQDPCAQRAETVAQDVIGELLFLVSSTKSKSFETLKSGIYKRFGSPAECLSVINEEASGLLMDTDNLQPFTRDDMEEVLERRALWELLDESVSSLTDARMQYVIRRRFGFHAGDLPGIQPVAGEKIPFAQIARELGCSSACASHLFTRGMWRLRHPSRSRSITIFLRS